MMKNTRDIVLLFISLTIMAYCFCDYQVRKKIIQQEDILSSSNYLKNNMIILNNPNRVVEIKDYYSKQGNMYIIAKTRDGRIYANFKNNVWIEVK